jgi:hypothetical protein
MVFVLRWMDLYQRGVGIPIDKAGKAFEDLYLE